MRPTMRQQILGLGLVLTLPVPIAGCGSIAKTVVFNQPEATKIFTPPKPDRVLTGRGWTNSIGSGTNLITVLHVTGENYYSLGYQHGQLLGPQVKATIEGVLQAADLMLPEQARKLTSHRIIQQLVAEGLDKAWAMMEP